VIAVMQDATILSTQARIAAVVSAVVASYGQRHEAHRLVMAHSLSRGGSRLAPLWSRLQAYLSTERPSGAITAPLDPADAFVLAHAFAGVFRAMISERENAPSQTEIERSLTRLVIRFLA
jgi:hypothetical protein